MKPIQSEYAPYYETYVSLTENAELIPQLKDQLNATLKVIEDLSEDQFNYAYSPDKWTVKELFQHIIDCEIVFAYRAFSIARGEQQHLPGFDQDDYAAQASKTDLTKNEVVEMYRQTRKSTISLVGYLAEHDLRKLGTASGNNLSARAAFYIILGHELHHINVLKRLYLNG